MKKIIVKALLMMLLILTVILTVFIFSGTGFTAAEIAAVFIITIAALFTVNRLRKKNKPAK